MAKIKVHELAKELDRQSKEIIAFLQEKGIEAKAAQSSVEEDAAALVRSAFGQKSSVKAEPVKEEIPEKKETPAKEEAAPVKDAKSPLKETVAEKSGE